MGKNQGHSETKARRATTIYSQTKSDELLSPEDTTAATARHHCHIATVRDNLSPNANDCHHPLVFVFKSCSRHKVLAGVSQRWGLDHVPMF